MYVCGGEDIFYNKKKIKITRGFVLGRIMAFQRCSCPNSQNLWICYVTWQGGIKVAYGISVANQLNLRQNGNPVLSMSTQGNHSILISERGKQESQYQNDIVWERLYQSLLILKMQGGPDSRTLDNL